MIKQYWVQTCGNNPEVICKTNRLAYAIRKLKNENDDAFIFDCIYRRVVRYNYTLIV